MKTLTTFAFLAVMAVGISGANASLRSEGTQNFYYYFGTPCSCGMQTMAAPCGAAPCAVAPVNPCCCEGTGLFGGTFIDGIL